MGAIRRAHSCIAKSTKIFRWEEAPRCNRAARSNWRALRITRSNRLRSIFNNRRAEARAESIKSIHVRRLAIEMHWHNRFEFLARLRGFRGQCWAHVVCHWIDVDPHWLHSDACDCAAGCEKCIRRAKHFFTRLSTNRHQRENDRV